MKVLNTLIDQQRNPSSRSITVISLDLHETGTYQTPQRRTFTTDLEMGTLNDLSRALSQNTSDGRNVSSASVSRVANRIIRPETRSTGDVGIRGRWDQERYRFILTIDLTNGRSKQSRRKVLTGYTDGPGIDANGNLDPNMILRVNNNIELRDVVGSNSHGKYTRTNVSSSNQLLVGRSDSPMRDKWRGIKNDSDYSLRPTDMMTTIGTRFAMGNEDQWSAGSQYPELNEGSIPDGGSILDTFANSVESPSLNGPGHNDILHNNNSNFSEGACNSTRKNLNSSSYVSRLLTGIRTAQLASEEYADDESLLYDYAAGNLQEQDTDDVVFSALGRLCEFNDTGEFTVADLYAADPTTDDNTNVFRTGGVHATFTNSRALDTSAWNRADITTLIATQIANAVSGTLIEELVAVADITFTNRTRNGEPELHVAIGGFMVDGLDEYQTEQTVTVRIENELVDTITQNGNLDVSVHVSADIYEETRIEIEIDDEPMMEFISPTWGDANFTPVMTNNVDSLNKMASDFINITSNIESLGGNSHTRTYASPNFKKY